LAYDSGLILADTDTDGRRSILSKIMISYTQLTLHSLVSTPYALSHGLPLLFLCVIQQSVHCFVVDIVIPVMRYYNVFTAWQRSSFGHSIIFFLLGTH